MNWTEIGEGCYVKLTKPHTNGIMDFEVIVSQIGHLSDKDVSDMLTEYYGDVWTRKTEWSSASGEPDVTSRWVRGDA